MGQLELWRAQAKYLSVPDKGVAPDKDLLRRLPGFSHDLSSKATSGMSYIFTTTIKGLEDLPHPSPPSCTDRESGGWHPTCLRSRQ